MLIAAGDCAPAKKGRCETARLILAGVVFVAVWIPFSFFIFSHVHYKIIAGPLVGGSLMGLAVLAAWVANRGNSSGEI